MDFQPTIFIGSSTEGKPVAERIRDGFEGFAQCNLWTDAFDFGNSYFDSLVDQIALYDYAILVATGDDVITSRRKRSAIARDNVLFEFGLFVGGLGKTRVFYVVQENTKIPSDLSGITLPFIPGLADPGLDESLNNIIDKLKAHISDKEATFDLGFLPSTALAYGYFVNFVERTVQRLLEDKAEAKEFALPNDQKFRIASLRFTVLIPNDLQDDMFKKVTAKRLKDGWQKLKVEPKDVRDYDFSVDISKAINGELHLVDIPFTLNALNKSIQLYGAAKHIGKDKRQTLLEQKEIRNFKRTLEFLISHSAIAQDLVNVEVVDV